MAFEKNNFYTAKKIMLNKSDFNVECNISTNASCVKVLTVQVEGCVQNQEVIEKSINYSGGIDVKVVFMTEEGEISSVYSTCPFVSKFEDERIVQNACALINVEIVDSVSEIIGGETLRVNVVLSQSGFVVFNDENFSLKCNDENICYQTEEIETVKFLGCNKDLFTIESEISLREKVKKVLLTESKAVVKNVEAGANYITISGDLISRVLYISENDKFESGYIHDSFKQEVELAGTTRDSLVEGYVWACQENIQTEIVEDEKGCKLTVKSPLHASVFAYETSFISVIKDLYSTKTDLSVVTSSFDMTNVCPIEVIDGKIEGSLSLEEDKPRVDKLLFNGANKVNVTNSYIKDGEIFVEGIAQTTVVYLNDENSSLYSVIIDVPFTMSDKIKCGNETNIFAKAVVSDADVVVKKGRELMYDAKVKVMVYCCNAVAGGVISEAQEGEFFPEKDYAMEVFFAKKGNDLWQVAKMAHVKEEMLLAQNPEVVFPIEKDVPLVLFYQRSNN